MKILDWCRLGAAVSLSVANSILPVHAGFGAAGAWILGTAFSTLLLSCAGGIHRIGFTAIAVLPPFVVNRVYEISAAWTMYRRTRTPSEAVFAMFPDTLLVSLFALALFVAVPLAIAFVTRHVACKTNHRLKLTRLTRSFCKRQKNFPKFSPAPPQWEAGPLSGESLGDKVSAKPIYI